MTVHETYETSGTHERGQKYDTYVAKLLAESPELLDRRPELDDLRTIARYAGGAALSRMQREANVEEGELFPTSETHMIRDEFGNHRLIVDYPYEHPQPGRNFRVMANCTRTTQGKQGVSEWSLFENKYEMWLTFGSTLGQGPKDHMARAVHALDLLHYLELAIELKEQEIIRTSRNGIIAHLNIDP